MTSAIQKTNDNIVGSFLKEYGVSLKNYAVREYNQDAFLKSAMLAILSNNDLVQATKTDSGKLSIFNALRYAATTGLSLNPQEGKCALVGYKDKNGNYQVQYQLMKNGIVELALASGSVEFLTADYVKENDIFKLKKSVNGDDYNHEPAIKNRGEVVGFYAAIKLKNGGTHVKYMTVEEINEVRDNYSKLYKIKKEISPWSNAYTGMGLKTVMKALLRNVSIGTDIDTLEFEENKFFETEIVTPGVTAEQAKEKLQAETKEVESDGLL